MPQERKAPAPDPKAAAPADQTPGAVEPPESPPAAPPSERPEPAGNSAAAVAGANPPLAASEAKEKAKSRHGRTRPADDADPVRFLRRTAAALLVCAIVAVAAVGAVHSDWQAAERSAPPPLLDGVAFSTTLYSADGALLRLTPAKDGVYRMKTPLAEIDPKVLEATLFYEDRLFRSHHGVNPGSIVRAAVETLLGERRMGASTITMQLARMRLGLETSTPRGKLRQIWHALRYEAHYSKDEILEAYLNLAPYGGNVEGVGAAARVWFHKSPKLLSAAQASALAVIAQNPVKRRPRAEGNDALDHARIRLGSAMIRAGAWPSRFADAVRAPLKSFEPDALPAPAPHYVRTALAHMRRAHLTTAVGTLNLALQKNLEGLVAETVARLKPWGVRNAALAVVDARSRALLALVGSANFHDASIAGEVSAWTARRSPGSTLKPFVYGLALDQGLIHEKTVLIDRPQSFGGWAPENADGAFRGPLSAEDALVLSRNVPAVDLERRLNPGLWELLRKSGVALPHDKDWYGLSIVLGGAETTMHDLAKLYAMLANDAVLRPVRVLESEAAPAQGEVISREAAFVLRRMLASRGETMTVRGEKFDLLYKTGTSNGWRDAWTAGSVGPYVIVAWLGDFAGAPNPQLQGAALAAPLFKAAALRLAAEKSLDWPDPVIPQDEAAEGKLKVALETVCTATGDLDTSLCPEKTLAWILPGKTSVRSSGVFREILVREATGLRACAPGEGVKSVVWEFWPTHFQKVFLEAGVVKRPPPPYEAGCERVTGEPGGRPPVITAPRVGAVLYAGGADGRARTLLRAGTDPDAKVLYWYAGSHFIGAAAKEKPPEWEAEPGVHRLTATDDLGRSTSITLTVKRR